jgi:prolyl oligopeptidase
MLRGSLVAVCESQFSIRVAVRNYICITAGAIKPVIEDYHGTKIADPYRYIENLDDPEVQAWMKAQNEYTRNMLTGVPGRQQLLARIRELGQSAPQVEARRLPGELCLVLKMLPGENTSKLYLRRGLNGQDRLLVDPDRITLVPADQGKGKNVIDGLAVSNNGEYIAVGVEPGGDELHGELHVIDTATGRETGDVIAQVGAEAWQPYWLPDDRSFVYGRLQKLSPDAPAAEVRQKFRAYLHVLGTDAEKDQPVFGHGVVPSTINVDPSLIASVHTQPGSRWALGLLNGSVTPNSAYYIEPVADLGKTNTEWREVADFSDGVTDIAIHNDDLYLLTYKDAPRYKVVRTDARHPDIVSAEPLVPAGQAVITGINPAQDALYVQLLDGGLNRLLRVPYGPHPQTEEVALPVKGTAFASTDPRLPGALLYLTSWARAVTIYAYNPETKRATDTNLQPKGPYDDPTNIESVEVKVPSYDGTLVPVSIIYPKKMKMDGSNPTLLQGYGGYGISFTPYFEPTRLAWHENGGETNIPELGSVKSETGFKALYAMSAYHHVKDQAPYPAVLLETGINDPRVDPWQMAKMTARLEAATSSGKPVLLRVDYAGGHGDLGGTREQADERLADEWSFLLWQFGVPIFQPKTQ